MVIGFFFDKFLDCLEIDTLWAPVFEADIISDIAYWLSSYLIEYS